MRNSLKDGNPATRKHLSVEFGKTLDLVMRHMKADLKEISPQPSEHRAFVQFVQGVVSLIRTHAVQICKIDDFFFQASQDYSPSQQDPRLHIAGILSYGLRLGEGDSGIVSQLFYYLCSNFASALPDDDRLRHEKKALFKGMRDGCILNFMLRTMLPAIIRATATTDKAYPMLDTYCGAVRSFLTAGIAPRLIPDEDLPILVHLFREILGALRDLAPSNEAELSASQVHITWQLVSLVEALRPTLETLSYTQQPPDSWQEMEEMLKLFGVFTAAASRHVDSIARSGDAMLPDGPTASLFQGLGRVPDPRGVGEPNLVGFTEYIAREMRRTAAPERGSGSGDATARVRGPASSAQVAGSELRSRELDMGEGLEGLRDMLSRWNSWWDEDMATGPRDSTTNIPLDSF